MVREITWSSRGIWVELHPRVTLNMSFHVKDSVHKNITAAELITCREPVTICLDGDIRV